MNADNDPARAGSRVTDRSQIGWTKNHWKIADADGSNTGENNAVPVQDYVGGSHFGHGELFFCEDVCYLA